MVNPAKHLVFWIAAAIIATAALCPSALRAQNVTLIKRFSALNGTVDFLPGAWVNVWKAGHSRYYRYEDGRFVRSPELPELLRDWASFDWGSVDLLDQLAVQNYVPSISRFLPPRAKVKQVEELSLRPRSSDSLILVCFTLKTKEEFPMFLDDTDIYMMAVVVTPVSATPGGRGATYKKTTFRKLWIRKLESDAEYGLFTVQKIPRLGQFALLYWESLAGSGSVQCLDVFRITE